MYSDATGASAASGANGVVKASMLLWKIMPWQPDWTKSAPSNPGAVHKCDPHTPIAHTPERRTFSPQGDCVRKPDLGFNTPTPCADAKLSCYDSSVDTCGS